MSGATKLKQITNCITLMGEHTPADTVEIKVKDNEIIEIDNLKIKSFNPSLNSRCVIIYNVLNI